MKARSILLFFLLICFSKSYCQSKPFDDFDFQNGGYFLLGIQSLEAEENDIVKKNGDWFIEDAELLNKIKSEWVFEIPGRKLACGYHYNILLCKKGSILRQIYINLECNEIRIGDKYYYFNPRLIAALESQMKKPRLEKDKFTSIKEARFTLEKMSNNDSILLAVPPKWLNYDGSLRFTYLCTQKIDCFEEQEKVLSELHFKIMEAFPNEIFKLKSNGGSVEELFITISCSKKLAQELNIKTAERSEWEPFDLDLLSYWKN